MDIAKGIGILIIVYGHSWFVATSLDLMYPILASFVLPLFFFLSGVFFKPEQPFVEMAVRKADGLLKPFFFTLWLKGTEGEDFGGGWKGKRPKSQKGKRTRKPAFCLKKKKQTNELE